MSLTGDFWMDFEKESQTKKDLYSTRSVFKNIGIDIYTLTRYPDNGSHQECSIYFRDRKPTSLPFEIRKGEDGYHYRVNGKEKKYNLRKDEKVCQNWIVHLDKDFSSPSLEEIFEIKESKSLVNIIQYCIDLYKKSLTMEVIRINEELEILDK